MITPITIDNEVYPGTPLLDPLPDVGVDPLAMVKAPVCPPISTSRALL